MPRALLHALVCHVSRAQGDEEPPLRQFRDAKRRCQPSPSPTDELHQWAKDRLTACRTFKGRRKQQVGTATSIEALAYCSILTDDTFFSGSQSHQPLQLDWWGLLQAHKLVSTHSLFFFFFSPGNRGSEIAIISSINGMWWYVLSEIIFKDFPNEYQDELVFYLTSYAFLLGLFS